MKAEDELPSLVVHPEASTSALKLDDLLTDSESDEEAVEDDGDASSDDDEAKALIAELKQDGIVNWVTKRQHMTPVEMLKLFGIELPPDLPDDINPHHILKMVLGKIMSKRDKRQDLNTVDDALRLLREAKHIMVLTGAGVSTSCGIPDFRSEHGIYARIHAETNGMLTDPQEMFDIDFFRENPSIFYSFAHELYPSNFTPSTTHRFIKLLETRGQLLRNYSQNIDTLEQSAGIERVLNCHGSFATARCIQCGQQVPGESIKADIFKQRVPLCPVCPQAVEEPVKEPPAKKRKISTRPWEDADDDDDDDGLAPNEWLGKPVLKPDITFFGEKLGDTFGEHLLRDRAEVDLLLVIGTSLKVAPVSDVLSHIPHNVPQILINRDPVTHAAFDIVLLGECDKVVRWLADQLDWAKLDDPPVAPPASPPERVLGSHLWLFEGANREHRALKSLYLTQSDDA